MVRRVFLAFLVFGVVGCGDGSVSPADVAGTYTLLSVNEEGLPAVLAESADFLFEVTAGSVTLNADLTCSHSVTQRVTDQGTETTDTVISACAYAIDDGFMLTRSGETVVLPGSILGTTLTIIEAGLDFVYVM